MVRWLGHKEAAEALLDCIENVCEAGIKTKDLGGKATTREVTDAVLDEIEHSLGYDIDRSNLQQRQSLRIGIERKSNSRNKENGIKRQSLKLGFD